MTTSPSWEQWDGLDFPAEKQNPTIYYYPGRADIEDVEIRNELADEIYQDGVTPSKGTAHGILESAIVTHGQVQYHQGELRFYTGTGYYDFAEDSHEATWVELDEYDD